MGRPTAYYTLAEAAANLNKSENDLLRMAGIGGLSLYVSYNGRVLDDSKKFTTCTNIARHRTNPDTGAMSLSILNSGWFSGELIISNTAAIELLTKERVFYSEFESYDSNDKENNRLKRIYLANHRGESARIPITRDILLIALDAASQENDHDSKSFDSQIMVILNPEHPWHSELLAVAVKAWIELYSKREGHKLEGKCKPNGGHIAMITKHLQEPGGQPLSKTSVEYLAKVINPSKSGGASATQE